MTSDHSIYFPLSGEYLRNELEENKSLAQKIFKKHHKPKDENRPICLCSKERPKMQVYLHSNGFYHLKRNPKTGKLHDKSCWSFGETVESYGATDFQSAVSLDIDSKKKIRVASSLTIADRGEQAPGDEGGIKRSRKKYERASLRGFFEFLWHEIGLLDKSEGEREHYSAITEKIDSIASNLKYNSTPVHDVLIMPSGLGEKQQREELHNLSLSKGGYNPKTRVLLLGLLNKVEIQDSGKGVIQLWNAPNYEGDHYSPKTTIKYFVNEKLAKRILKTIHIKENSYEFDSSSKDGYLWIIATAQPQESHDSSYCYPFIKDADIVSVSNEHVPISLGKTILNE